jgi:hypothetical protein
MPQSDTDLPASNSTWTRSYQFKPVLETQVPDECKVALGRVMSGEYKYDDPRALNVFIANHIIPPYLAPPKVMRTTNSLR